MLPAADWQAESTQQASYLAADACVALGTSTLVCPVAVLTGATILAGPGVTFIDVMLAVYAHETRWAHTGEGVDAILASATIEAGAEKEKEEQGPFCALSISGVTKLSRSHILLG